MDPKILGGLLEVVKEQANSVYYLYMQMRTEFSFFTARHQASTPKHARAPTHTSICFPAKCVAHVAIVMLYLFCSHAFSLNFFSRSFYFALFWTTFALTPILQVQYYLVYAESELVLVYKLI